MFRRVPVLIASFGLAMLVGCYSGEETHGRGVKPLEKRNVAPDFALKDSTGNPLKLSDLKGKVVMLNFWATWCGPCRTEIPWLIEFEQKFRDRGFAVVGVAMDDEGWEVVKPYMARTKINYRMVLGEGLISEHYGGVNSIPQTFIIDREGRIGAVHEGLPRKKEYLDEIDQLLGVTNTADLRGGGLFAGPNQSGSR